MWNKGQLELPRQLMPRELTVVAKTPRAATMMVEECIVRGVWYFEERSRILRV